MSVVTETNRRQYVEEGYTILEGVLPVETLQMLREECSYAIGYKDAEMDAAGITTDEITHRGSRYFIANRYRRSARLRSFLFGETMATVVRSILGDDALLFNEQWVVKGAEQGMQFAWHQDSGYVLHEDERATSAAYLSCWCALDDMSEENGTVSLLPHDRGGTSEGVVDHVRQAGTNDLVGYTGDDPGIPVVVPAGSIACFTSHTLHRSSANTTDRMRRVYLAQYSTTQIRSGDGALRALAVPFLRNGANVYDPIADTPEEFGPPAREASSLRA